jgi:leucyl aminopeptidase (aminopeptidase T)
MNPLNQAENAAKTILTQCLDLPKGATVVIVGDDTTHSVSHLLAESAVSLGLYPQLVCYTRSIQLKLGGSIPAGALTYLSEADAVMVCLNGDSECFAFRDHIRETAWQARRKVAHMPGINLKILRIADVDYARQTEQCAILALALAKGHEARIRSWDASGAAHHLTIPLDPWKRLPIISDGIIQGGSWGNVPSGETYIAPPENQAYGEIVINGSIPGYRMNKGEGLVLSFRDGRLVDWGPRAGPAGKRLYEDKIAFAQGKNDPNWDVLAELGLGVNPRVRRLTGNPLLDEKKYGSLHIALGDSRDMGGTTDSAIHCDMVCLQPDVWIDDFPVLHGGRIVIDPLDWREDYRSLQPPEEWGGEFTVQASAINTEADPHGQLKRIWHTGSGRTCSVPVGDEHSAMAVNKVYQWLLRHARPASLAEMAHQRRLGLVETQKLAYLLYRYGLINTNNHLE